MTWIVLATLLSAASPAALTGFEAAQPVRLVGEGLQPGSAARLVTDMVHSGKQAVRLDYQFIERPAGLQYAGFALAQRLPGRIDRFYVWVKGDGAGQAVRLRLTDVSGETHQFTLGSTDFEGWRLMSCRVGLGGDHWAGDGNGQLDEPIAFDSLLVDQTVRPAKGTLYFDDMMTTPYVPRVDPEGPLTRAAARPMALRVQSCDGPAPRLGGEALDAASRLVPDAQMSHDGRGAWRLDYRFVERNGLQYIEIPLEYSIEQPAGPLTLWLRGDGSGHALRLRMSDASGEIHQQTLGTLDFVGWREFRVEMKAGDPHWGGDDNGRLDGRVRLTSVLLDATKKPSQGSIWLDEVGITANVRPADAVQVRLEALEPGRVLSLDEPLRVRLSLDDMRLTKTGTDAAAAAQPVVVTYRLVSPTGVVSAAEPVANNGAVLPATVTLPVRERRYGLYTVLADWRVDGDQNRARVNFAKLPPMPAQTDQDTNLFGACFHFAQHKGELPRNYAMFARIGGHWMRDEYGWGTVESAKGQYGFPDYNDRYVRALPANGLRGFYIFDYGNSLYDDGQSPASPAAQAAFAEYARRLTAQYKDVVSHWEVFNEPNIGFWKPKPDAAAYASLLRATYAAVKQADPNATVVGICTAGVDFDYIDKVLAAAAGSMDAVSIHPYRYPTQPEAGGLVADLRKTRALMAKYGLGEKPLWLTEVGWPNQQDSRGCSEIESGNYLVRMFTLARSQPHAGPIFWYDFQNDGVDPKYNEDNFGLINRDYTPKQPYVAAGMMNRVLCDKAFSRDLALAYPAYAHEYLAADGRRTLVLWATPVEAEVTMALDAREVEVSDASGELRQQTVTGGRLTLTVGETPVFVTGRFAAPTVTAKLAGVEG